jgi:hypothetical protein
MDGDSVMHRYISTSMSSDRVSLRKRLSGLLGCKTRFRQAVNDRLGIEPTGKSNRAGHDPARTVTEIRRSQSEVLRRKTAQSESTVCPEHFRLGSRVTRPTNRRIDFQRNIQ